MTRLLDVAQEMGIVCETSRTGRWLRIHAAEDTSYVVEAAYGGYYTFSDARTERVPELHLDPAAAIRAAMARGAGERPTGSA